MIACVWRRLYWVVLRTACSVVSCCKKGCEHQNWMVATGGIMCINTSISTTYCNSYNALPRTCVVKAASWWDHFQVLILYTVEVAGRADQYPIISDVNNEYIKSISFPAKRLNWMIISFLYLAEANELMTRHDKEISNRCTGRHAINCLSSLQKHRRLGFSQRKWSSDKLSRY